MSIAMPHLPRRRGRWAASLALLGVAAAVVAVVESNGGNHNPSAGAGTTATGAATVRRRNLVATDTQSGTLSYADQQTVYNRLSGTITWVPQVGQVIRAGHALFAVDNKPVLLMNGSTPAYRALTASDVSGPDVYELNRNLVALGYNPDGIVVDDKWQAATTAGVEDLQYHLGDSQNGTLTLGQVVFLPGPQMIQTVDTTIGSTAASYAPAAGTAGTAFVDYPSMTGTTDTGTTGTSTTGATGTGTTGATDTTISGAGPTSTTGTGTTGTTTSLPRTTPVRSPTNHRHKAPSGHDNRSPSSAGDNLSRQTLRQLLRLIQEQQRQLQAEARAAHSPPSSSGTPTRHSHPSSHNSGGHGSTGNSGNSGTRGGSGGGSATALLSTSSTRLVVTVDLDASSQSEAVIGEHVTVEMPNGSTAAGHITAVSPVAQSSGSGNGSDSGGGGAGGSGSGSGASTVPVTIVLNKPAKGGGLDQASVSVNFVQSKAHHVLSVPVTALLATSGSAFAVQEANAPHKLIPVRTGLFAAGYVAISGHGIHPGLQVTDSQG